MSHRSILASILFVAFPCMAQAAMDLGIIGIENLPLNIDTLTSSFDTELGVFDNGGLLLAENDDTSASVLQSEIALPDGLAAGSYSLALGGWDTVFDDGPSAIPLTASEGGTYHLNHPAGTSSGNLDSNAVLFFDFSIVSSHTWNVDRSDDWNDPLNWSPNTTAPITADANVIFGDITSSPRVISVESPVTANRIAFDHSLKYTIAGAGDVNLATNGIPFTGIAVNQGTHEFQAVVNALDDISVEVANDSTLVFNDALNLNGNTLIKAGSGTMELSDLFNLGGGTLIGLDGVISTCGAVAGNLENNRATLDPCALPHVLKITGNYSQNSGATVAVDIAGTGHDQLLVNGASGATLDGTLQITTDPNFSPNTGSTPGTIGDSFVILSASNVIGSFRFKTGTYAGQGKFYVMTTNPTNVSLGVFQALEGDTNGNRRIDISDFNVLALHFDPTGNLAPHDWTTGDFDLDDDVDISDFNVLVRNFMPGVEYGTTGTIPEPSSLVLWTVGLIAATGVWLNRKMTSENDV